MHAPPFAKTFAPPFGVLCIIVALGALVFGRWLVCFGLLVAGVLLWWYGSEDDPVMMAEFAERYDAQMDSRRIELGDSKEKEDSAYGDE